MPTTNPVPSQDPSDLLFNAGKLDEVVSGYNATYTDRLGISRRTMAGIDAAADVVLGGLGYAPPVAYASGIALTLTTQTVEYAGEVYAPKVANLPFTTSGTFETAKFRLIQGVASADLASGGGAAMVGYTPTGSVATTVQSKLRETVSVKDFGAVGDGVNDDTSAIQAAINAAGSSTIIKFPAGTYLVSSPFALNSANVGIKFIGDGASATTIKKAFSGDLIYLSSCPFFELSRMTVDGQYGTYTGRCAVLTGTSTFPIFHDLVTIGFSGSHIAFGADAGFGADIFNHTARLGAGQTSCTGVAVTGKDTGYSVRKITGSNYSGPIDMSAGCDNVFITGCQFTQVVTSSNCGHIFIQGCRWGNAGNAVTIYGNTHVIGCSFAQSVTLDVSFDGAFIGNHQDGGSAPYFTNNSPGCQVFHNDPSGLFHVNKAKVEYQKVGEIEICNISTIGDSNYSYIFGASPAIVMFSTPLTANRTITLPTTGGRAGTRVRFARNVGDTGGPWTIGVGGTGKTLPANTWCDVLFNGSYWLITGAGNL